jgi:DHA1 family bicyclomycin/chloramphenicol resistance-like MFS transporter
MCTTTLGLLATDLFVPSLPHLEEAFETNRSNAQLTLSLNLVAFALAQLLLGPIVDRVSRRRVIISGMWLFAFSNVACAVSWSINALIISRILQGLSCSAAAVIVLVVIRETYEGKHAIRVMSVLGAVTSLSPLFGAIIGGYIHIKWGWRTNFIFVGALSATIAIVLWRTLPETNLKLSSSTPPTLAVRTYLDLLQNSQFVRLSLASSALMAGLLAYITGAPFVFQQIFEIPVSSYGYYHGTLVFIYIVGNFTAAYAANFLTPQRIIQLGVIVSASPNLVLLGLLSFGHLSLLTTLICLVLFCFGMGLVYAVAPLQALTAVPGRKGTATALFGTLKITGAALGALTVSIWGQNTAYSLILIVGLYAFCALIICTVIKCQDEYEA